MRVKKIFKILIYKDKKKWDEEIKNMEEAVKQMNDWLMI